MGLLDELLAGGQRQKEYSDFVDRYEQGNPSQGYSDQEVLKRGRCRAAAGGVSNTLERERTNRVRHLTALDAPGSR